MIGWLVFNANFSSISAISWLESEYASPTRQLYIFHLIHFLYIHFYITSFAYTFYTCTLVCFLHVKLYQSIKLSFIGQENISYPQDFT